MMNDRELLEFAAKAAGFKYATKPEEGDELGRIYSEHLGLWIWHFPVWWNPLTDDGDALRLAVKLKFNFAFKPVDTDVYPPSDSGVTVWLRHPAVYGLPHTMQLPRFVYEDNNGDPYAATRRAIVRAAAEIGKEMK